MNPVQDAAQSPQTPSSSLSAPDVQAQTPPALSAPFRLSPTDLGELFERLRQAGHHILGPKVQDGAIVLGTLRSPEDLPVGWTEAQEAGRYRLMRRQDRAYFGFANGPQSWKKYLHPAELRIFAAQRTHDGSFEVTSPRAAPNAMAFIGVRSCDLHAIRIQETVFQSATQPDPTYLAALEKAFLVSVQCTQAGGTCFCASTNTGPRASSGFDLALTELLWDDETGSPRHEFLLEVGSLKGERLLDGWQLATASSDDILRAQQGSEAAASMMGRHLDTHGLKERLAKAASHERWEQIAQRCLTCANCTLVCPTCFCTSIEDTTDLTGQHAERWRKWDSCFTQDFSYLHGGSVRVSGASRYRQWMTHKLSTWHDQFGTSGCVGCGRCISWCPVGIDITAEAEGFRLAELATRVEPTVPSASDGFSV